MKRLQRLRYSKHVRDLCAETEFNSAQLVQPLFVVESLKADETILGLKGVNRHSLETVHHQVEKDLEAGVRNFILFQVPRDKSLSQFDPQFAKKVIGGLKKRFGQSLAL